MNRERLQIPRGFVDVRFTIGEAVNLSHAAGNTTDDPNTMAAVFVHPAGRDACYRAKAKLDAAIQAAGGWNPRRRRGAPVDQA